MSRGFISPISFPIILFLCAIIFSIGGDPGTSFEADDRDGDLGFGAPSVSDS